MPLAARLTRKTAKKRSLSLSQRTILMVLYSTGMRNAELRHLQVGDIDSRRMPIHIQRGKGGTCRSASQCGVCDVRKPSKAAIVMNWANSDAGRLVPVAVLTRGCGG